MSSMIKMKKKKTKPKRGFGGYSMIKLKSDGTVPLVWTEGVELFE